MTINTNAALRTIADWPITDPANMDAVNMAQVARAALTTAAAVPAAGMVMVPEVPDERMERAIAGAFCGTVYEAREAWAAGIAAAPKAEPVQAGEYPPLPAPFIGVQDRPWGGHAEVIRSAIGEDGVVSCYTEDQMRAYVDADRAMRAQAAPTPSEWDVRGRLAASLTCWHRLTGQEAAELVALFQGHPAQAAPAAGAHIQRPYTLAEIKAKIASNDYSAELMLQHAMLLLEKPDAVAGPREAPEGWRDQFAEAVYADLEAADNQDVPLEEYPTRVLKALDSIVGPRHPTVIHWRNDAIQACIAIAYRYCRDPESFQYLKQDLQALIFAAPTTQAAPMESVLIDGVAYQTPAPVAAELLRLHIDALQAAPQPAVQQGDAMNWQQLRSALAMVMLGWGSRQDRTMETCYAVLDSVTEPGLPLALLRTAPDWRDATHPAAPVAQGDAEDAARYRWLRCSRQGRQRAVFLDSETVDELDAAIDAARSQAKEGA